MKITSIKQQVKRRDRYAVYVDEKYTFSLGESELLRIGLRIGQEVTAAQLEQLRDTAAFDKAYDSVLNLIARRQRSEWEVRTYAQRKGFDESVTNEIIERLRERQYLDDLAFAKSWVQSRRLLKPTSKRKLVYELKAKHVAADIISAVLADDEVSDVDQLSLIIEKKRRQVRFSDNDKLMAYLLRQGYGYQDVKAALANTEPEDY